MVCGGTRCACWLKKDSVMALNLKAGVNLRFAKVQFLGVSTVRDNGVSRGSFVGCLVSVGRRGLVLMLCKTE